MTEDKYGDYRFVVDGDYIEIVEKSSNKTVGELSYCCDTGGLVADYYQPLPVSCIQATVQWIIDNEEKQ